jgi:LPXTG-site transpeptidase (sortase) family protein
MFTTHSYGFGKVGTVLLLLFMIFSHHFSMTVSTVASAHPPEASFTSHLPVALTIPHVLMVPQKNPAERTVVPASLAPVAVSLPLQTVLEAHLVIPEIGVNAVIKDMETTPDGAMDVPGNRVDVGWFSLGTTPGEIGSAVIGGHNRWDGGSGVFVRLDQLAVGDVLSVVDKNGVSTFFAVREMRTYEPTDFGGDIFNSEGLGIHLNLITCSGVFDPATGTYTKRLVVFTDAV